MNPANSILAIIDSFANKHVLIIGDLMIDRYLTGSVHRISPEAPVPVVNLATIEDRLGGAANVALNCRSLGSKCTLCGIVGKDDNGLKFSQLMDDADLNTSGLVWSTNRPTTVKSRVLAQAQQLIRVDIEQSHDANEQETRAIIEQVDLLLKTGEIDVVILQDYDKGSLTDAIIHHVASLAAKLKIPVAVDPKFRHFFSFEGVTLFKPNLKEVGESMNTKVSPNMAALTEADTYLRSKLHQRDTMITLSEHGIYYNDGNNSGIAPTKPRQIADVSGAGDTVIALSALCLAANLKLPIIAQLSNMAGGLVCETSGVTPIDISALKAEIVEYYAK